ncbi:L-allo-threonine aldolase [Nasonia vitripennis]|uniref:Aromatic amino acid beta-eliminating lyase/threonine aldolase domain-containing protein n=1 Tax=Nasonia vitripennis TaxID=7425 RepID=A0A7M7PX91_NASVI|nr:L-allo-threonine aldolase [Nasonia vitripennis]
MAYGVKSTVDLVKYAKEKNASIVDLRSDTISRLSPGMRKAMFEAEVGDDVFGDDPTVKLLEEKIAKMLGKEAAIFVTSGTMSNLIAVLNHCEERGSEAYCGESSHIVLHEQGGAAQLGGVSLCPIPNEPDGTYSLRKLESKLKSNWLHEPVSKLVCAENTITGRVLPQAWVDQLIALARRHGLKLHLDGARIWNAAAASGRSVQELAQGFDSVSVCLSKGLGAPVGSLLCASREFIHKARRTRKVLGGGMRQVGVLAAAGLQALVEVLPVLHLDHRRAREIAEAVNAIGSENFEVDMGISTTNMVLVQSKTGMVTRLVTRLQEVWRDEEPDDRIIVRGMALTDCLARFVIYYEVTDDMVRDAVKKINLVIREIDAEVQRES